jgi:hypothetical protein
VQCRCHFFPSRRSAAVRVRLFRVTRRHPSRALRPPPPAAQPRAVCRLTLWAAAPSAQRPSRSPALTVSGQITGSGQIRFGCQTKPSRCPPPRPSPYPATTRWPDRRRQPPPPSGVRPAPADVYRRARWWMAARPGLLSGCGRTDGRGVSAVRGGCCRSDGDGQIGCAVVFPPV